MPFSLVKALKCSRGNVAVISALVAFPILALCAAAIDLFSISNHKAQLQAAVDAGALAGAGEMAVASFGRGNDGIVSTATTAAQKVMLDTSDIAGAVFAGAVDRTAGNVTVTGTLSHDSLISGLGMGGKTIEVSATAENLQKSPLCILQTKVGGIKVSDRSRISASGCSVHANDFIDVGGNALLKSERAQAVNFVKGPIDPQGAASGHRVRHPA